MNKPSRESDYRRHAEECVQLAQNTRTAAQRTMLLHIAETWLRLADTEAEKIREPAVASTAIN